MFLRKRSSRRIKSFIVLCLTAGVLALFVLFVSRAGVGASKQGLAIAETGIRRAAVQCYALEGVYPPTYEYLCEHYGVQVSEELYFVDYRFAADNLMPEITVLLQSNVIEEVMN